MHNKLRFEYEIPAQSDDFEPADFVEKLEKFIKGRTSVDRGEKVAISVSGGVDSTTTAFLLREIVGENLYPFFIDDGLRRRIRGREEYEIAEEIFHDFFNFEVIHAKNDSLPALLDSTLTDGEEKRKKFQEIYTMVSNKHISDIGASWIADGTIKPDIGETNARIKTQHNVDIVYSAKKIEPLASLHKPHVRKLAKYIGVPDEIVYKIPCPGPAQLIRVVGSISEEKLEVAKTATDITEQQIERYCHQKSGKRFEHDERTGVRSPFQMFSAVLDASLTKLDGLSTFILNFLGKENGIKCYKMENRTTYIERGEKRQKKPVYMPILWVEGKEKELKEQKYEKLLELSKEAWLSFGYPRIIYQVYSSTKAETEASYEYNVAIRVVESKDAKAALPMKIDLEYLMKIGEEIAKKCKNVGRVGYCLGIKPPSTIEFE